MTIQWLVERTHQGPESKPGPPKSPPEQEMAQRLEDDKYKGTYIHLQKMTPEEEDRNAGVERDKDGNVNQIEMPLVADDYVTNTAYIRRNHKIRDDENFKPNNSIELSNSIVCLIDDYKEDIDSYEGETDGNDIFDDIYTSVKTILKKV